MTNYGIDAPKIILNLFLQGIGCLIFAFGLYYNVYAFRILLLILLFGSAISFLLFTILMLLSSLIGKRWQTKRLINSLQLSGNETILDVGCGRGLLLIEAAKRLKTGKAVGIDIWQQEDLSGNNKQATLENAKTENVADNIELIDADVRSMPFDDNSFDAIVSSMTIHNIYNKDERKKALLEIKRVLKPSGTILIQDFQHTKEYENVLKELGMQQVKRSGLQWLLFPPVRVVRAKK